MNFSEYQTKAMTFRKESANAFYAALGLAEEAGEVCGKIAKAVRDGFPTAEAEEAFQSAVAKELGDVLWMVAAVAADNGLDLQVVAGANIAKLESRQIRGVISGSGDNR